MSEQFFFPYKGYNYSKSNYVQVIYVKIYASSISSNV